MLHARDVIGYLSEADGEVAARAIETCAKQRGQSQRHGSPRDGGCGWLQLARLCRLCRGCETWSKGRDFSSTGVHSHRIVHVGEDPATKTTANVEAMDGTEKPHSGMRPGGRYGMPIDQVFRHIYIYGTK